MSGLSPPVRAIAPTVERRLNARTGEWIRLRWNLVIALAVLAGARTVILLGYDGKPAANGATHWHGGHPKPSSAAIFQHARRAFSAVERDLEAVGVRVVNCSPGSAIESFPKADLAETLEALPC